MVPAWVQRIGLFVCIYSAMVANAAPSLDSLSTIKWASLDHPLQLQQWSLGHLNNPAQKVRDVQWVRAMLAFAVATNDLGPLEPIQKRHAELVAATDLALSLGLYEEYAIFRNLLTFVPDAQGQTLNIISTMDDLLEKTQQWKQPQTRARVLWDYAYHLQSIGQRTQALQLLNELNQILTNEKEIDEIDRIYIKNQTALSFVGQGHKNMAFGLYQEIADFCSRHQLRYLSSVISRNLGNYYLDLDEQDALTKAEAYFDKAFKLSRELQNPWLEASLHLSLSLASSKRKRWQQGYAAAKEAERLYLVSDDKPGQASAIKERARIEIQMGRFADALKSIEQAIRIYGSDFKTDQVELKMLQAEALAGRGEIHAAFQKYKEHVEAFKKLNRETLDRNYSELQVEIGLQVEAERNNTLRKENELQAQKLRASENMRIAVMALFVLSLVIVALAVLAVLETRKVRKSRLKMQRILSHIEEGICTIDSRMRIESESSAYLQKLLGFSSDLTGRNIIEVLFKPSQLNEDEQSVIRETLHAFFEETLLSWDLNEEHLPKELHFLQPVPRMVALYWVPLLSKDQKIQGVLLTLRDITDQRRLEAMIDTERKRSHRLENLMSELLHVDRPQVGRVLQNLEELLSQLQTVSIDRIFLQTSLRNVHTMKGVSRTLGLRQLSQATHAFEDALLNFQKEEGSSARLQESCQEYRQIIESYKQVLRDVFQTSSVSLSQSTATLPGVIASQMPTLLEQMEKEGLHCARIDIQDSVLRWPAALLEAIARVLVLGLSNSIDHGFVWPNRRGKTPLPAIFQVEARVENETLHLDIRDNGAGLDWERLAGLAKKLGFVPRDHETLADVVFVDGASTADSTTESSGRGVGMPAIRSMLTPWNGQVFLEDNDRGQGSRLRVQLIWPEQKADRAPLVQSA